MKTKDNCLHLVSSTFVKSELRVLLWNCGDKPRLGNRARGPSSEIGFFTWISCLQIVLNSYWLGCLSARKTVNDYTPL